MPDEPGLPVPFVEASVFQKIEANLLQFVFELEPRRAMRAAPQPHNSRRSTVDHACEFRAEVVRSILAQPQFCFFRGEPGWIAIRLLRRFPSSYFAKVGGYGGFGNACVGRVATVARERNFLDPAMHTRFFKSL